LALFKLTTYPDPLLDRQIEEIVWELNRQLAAQADSTAVDVAGLRADFNALLAKLRAAGWMAS
jgi:hypothetical protein